MVEDKLLIFGFKQGNRESLRQIYDKYKIELLKLAVVLIGNRNMAEDIVHDVFVKFAESADRIKLSVKQSGPIPFDFGIGPEVIRIFSFNC